MKNTSLVSFKFIVSFHTHTRSSCLEGEGNRLFTSEAGFANLLACNWLKGRILAVMSSHYMDQITVLDLNMMTFFHQWNSSARKCQKYSAYNSGSFPFSIVDEWCRLRTVACWHIVALNPRASAPISDSFSFYDAYIGKVTYNSWTAIISFNRARVMRTGKKNCSYSRQWNFKGLLWEWILLLNWWPYTVGSLGFWLCFRFSHCCCCFLFSMYVLSVLWGSWEAKHGIIKPFRYSFLL